MSAQQTLLQRTRAALRARPAPPAGASTDGVPPPAGGGRRRRRGLALAALAGAVAAIGWLLLGGGSREEGGRSPRTGATATVTRQTLVEREDVAGTLGYAGKRTVVHRSESESGGTGSSGASSESQDTPASPSGGGEDDAAASGSDQPDVAATPALTAVARAGSIVRRGGVLYRSSGEPVVLMYGSTPAYRTLSSGVAQGRDVRQLEHNLVELGFGDGSLTVDREFTSATAAALSEWQEALGLEQTGSAGLGRVVFLPGARRMGAAKTTVGSLLSDGTEVIATTSTRRVVSVELEASSQSLARDGARVAVALPDGRGVNGRISSVGRVAREQESESSGGELGGDTGSGVSVIDVTVSLNSKRGTGRLDEAPVTVGLARETRRNVLTVPVTALLAREGGGYALEVVSGGSRRTVPVRTGLFASGLVEVSGRRIADGMRVAVPR